MSESDLHFVSPRGRGGEIFAELEAPSWAPWLRFSAAPLDLQATQPARAHLRVDIHRAARLQETVEADVETSAIQPLQACRKSNCLRAVTRAIHDNSDSRSRLTWPHDTKLIKDSAAAREDVLDDSGARGHQFAEIRFIEVALQEGLTGQEGRSDILRWPDRRSQMLQ